MDVRHLFSGKNSLEEFEEECQTVMSDITDNNTVLSVDINIRQKQEELKVKIENNLNKLTADKLKEKCKLHNIGSLSKLKKPELIGLLLEHYGRLVIYLNDLTVNELKNKCNSLNISGTSKQKKNGLIMLLLTHCSDKMIFNLCSIVQINAQEQLNYNINDKFRDKNEKQIRCISETINCYDSKSVQQIIIAHKKDTSQEQQEQEQQRLIAELLIVERLQQEQEQQRLIAERLQQERLQQEQQRLIAEQLVAEQLVAERLQQERLQQERLQQERLQQERLQQERLQQERIKHESKKKKQTMPKQIKTIIWNHYIGEDIIKHKCLCCKKVTITNTTFDVGHVISEKQGGTHEINNLRPICGACNHSMGTENMIDFVVKFGLYIG